MRCPKDGTTLGRRVYEANIEINECPQCSGIWLDRNELEQIQNTVEKDHSVKAELTFNKGAKAFHVQNQLDENRLGCPNCKELMFKKEHGFTSQVVVDLCPFCKGLWLDAGELQELEIFFEKERENVPNLSKTGLLWMGIKNFFDRG
jgi:uncharacterized protein